jgi:hypothetical protein
MIREVLGEGGPRAAVDEDNGRYLVLRARVVRLTENRRNLQAIEGFVTDDAGTRQEIGALLRGMGQLLPAPPAIGTR